MRWGRDISDIPNTAALYVHWPYCTRICPYCDFNVHKDRKDDDLLPAILRDMAANRELSGSRTLTSLHFGGGTPSLMTPAQVEAVIAEADALWGFAPGSEIALEVNPSVTRSSHMRDLARVGVNRLSLGVQTFDTQGLALLGRDHSADQARAVAEAALQAVPNTSLDLIFGWRGQTEASWRADLATAVGLRAPHVSTYQLTIEPGTAFARHEARGDSHALKADTSAQYYDIAAEVLEPAGLEHYEVSNFALKSDNGRGARSRHNLSYWRGEDYIGVGPGAHGRLTLAEGRVATTTPLKPSNYASAPAPRLEPLSGEDVATEYVLMGLRTDEGIDPARFQQLAGRDLMTEGLEDWFEAGDRLVATRDGRRVLDSLTAALLG